MAYVAWHKQQPGATAVAPVTVAAPEPEPEPEPERAAAPQAVLDPSPAALAPPVAEIPPALVPNEVKPGNLPTLPPTVPAEETKEEAAVSPSTEPLIAATSTAEMAPMALPRPRPRKPITSGAAKRSLRAN
jgi:hypothetical protein